VPGCSTPQPLLPPGEDPNRLAAAIAKRGQYDGPVNAEPPGSGVVADCVTTSAKVAASSGIIALLAACVVAEGLSHSSGADLSGFGKALNAIWSDD
jgi:hypothetical protein